MATITGAGTFTQIVDQLIALKMQSRTRIEGESTEIRSAKLALSGVEANLLSLKSQVANLAQGATLFGHKATSSDSAKISAATVSVDSASDVDLGEYEIKIIHKANPFRAWNSAKISKGIDSTVSLTATGSGIRTTVTAGKFTINGVQISVADGDSLDTVLGKIQTEITNGTGGLNLTSVSYNSTTDRVEFVGSDQNYIQFGATGDTSNFLQAIGVQSAVQDTSGGSTKVTSTNPLGTISRADTLSTLNGRLAQTITINGGGNSGDFYINDIKIEFDLTKDSLQDVIERINQSSAGVTASYDATNDRFQIQSEKGGVQVRLENGTSNFLYAMGLINSGTYNSGGGLTASKIGNTAQFEVNGHSYQSNSNTGLQGYIRGITFDLQGVDEDKATISVSRDTDGAVSTVKKFVEQYNSTYQELTDTLKSGPLARDGSLRSLRRRIYFSATGDVGGLPIDYNGLMDLGINRTHTANPQLQIADESKLRAALEADPSAVADLFSTTATKNSDAETRSLLLQSVSPILLPAASTDSKIVIKGDVTGTYTNGNTIYLVDGKTTGKFTVTGVPTYNGTDDQTTITLDRVLGDYYSRATSVGVKPTPTLSPTVAADPSGTQVTISGNVTANYSAGDAVYLNEGDSFQQLTVSGVAYANNTTTLTFKETVQSGFTGNAQLWTLDPNTSATLFTLESPGYASRLSNLIDAYAGSGTKTGVLDRRQSTLDTRQKSVQRRLDDFDRHIADERARLTHEYAALEATLSTLQSQFNFLTQQSTNMQGMFSAFMPSGGQSG